MTISPEELYDLCDMIAEGKSLRSICRDKGYAESSVRRWIMQNADAMAHAAHARELGCDALADECLDIADDKTTDPADKRIRIETRLRLIGKWSQRYSDKLTVNNNTTVTHRYDLDNLSDAELDQLEVILSNAVRGESREVPALTSGVH